VNGHLFWGFGVSLNYLNIIGGVMSNWQSFIIDHLLPELKDDDNWFNYFHSVINDDYSPIGIHLAIFNEPYLKYILNGQKTVESRFAINKIAPYKQISKGDILLLKKSSGPIMGICKVKEVWFYNLNPELIRNIRNEFTESLCAQDPFFWEQRVNASFATLLQISDVKEINPTPYQKSDRRGWVVLKSTINSPSLFA
jgi:ASC-1-like (ASCH) protein